MMEHEQPRTALVVLLTCHSCAGNTTLTAADGSMNACHECINGYQAVALPLAEVVAAAALQRPDAIHRALMTMALAASPARHPLVYNVTDVPSCLQSPLVNNRGDIPVKKIE